MPLQSAARWYGVSMLAPIVRVGASLARVGAFLLILAASGIAPASDPLEWEREADPAQMFVSPVDSQGYPTHVIARVVDDLNGQPVSGASVTLRSEAEFPVTGLVAPERTGFTDEEGWVRILAADLGWEPTWLNGYWLYVEAAGYGGAVLDSGLGANGEEIRLQRPRNVVVRVCDELDRPVPGAVIGVRDGRTCGHMPDQRVAVSDADGIAVIPSLCDASASGFNDGWEGWVVAESLESTYISLDATEARREPETFRFRPSYPVLGTLVDEAGKPVAGAYVCGGMGHRGPWAASDEDGRFRLLGTDPATDKPYVVQVYDGRHDKDRPADTTFVAPPRGIRRIVRLPRPGQPPLVEQLVRVDIAACDGATGDVLEQEPIMAWRDDDGWTARGFGRLVALPRGVFTVEAGGGPSPFGARRMRVVVGNTAPKPLVLGLGRHPEIELVCEDDPEAIVALRLVTADGVRLLGEKDQPVPERVAIPPGVECALLMHVKLDGHEFIERLPIPVAMRSPGAAALKIHATRSAQVTAHLVGPDGERVSGRLVPADRAIDLLYSKNADDLGPADLEPAAAFYVEGPVEVVALAEDDSLLARRMPVFLPAGSRGGSPVHLGTIELGTRAEHRLTVLDAHESPIHAERATCRRGERLWDIRLDDGVHEDALMPLETGDEIVVTAHWDADEYATRSVRWLLEGPGPWVLRDEPRGASIVVAAHDEDGNVLQAVVVIDGKAHPPCGGEDEEDRRCEIRGLAPGPHRVAVAAAGHVSKLYGVVLSDGEVRTIATRLRRASQPDDGEDFDEDE